jgi:hypothetical protein
MAKHSRPLVDLSAQAKLAVEETKQTEVLNFIFREKLHDSHRFCLHHGVIG